MKITNAYQAILAKLGGNKEVTIPAPRNKYEKLLSELKGCDCGGSTDTVIADTQTVVGSGGGEWPVVFELTPTSEYGLSAEQYMGKTARVELTTGAGEVADLSVVLAVADDYIGAEVGDYGELQLMDGPINFSGSASKFADGDSITIKVSIAEESSGSGGGLVVHDNDGTLDKTWQEIHDAMASGRSVVVTNDSNSTTYLVLIIGFDVDANIYFVRLYGDAQAYLTDSVDAYPSVNNGGDGDVIN